MDLNASPPGPSLWLDKDATPHPLVDSSSSPPAGVKRTWDDMTRGNAFAFEDDNYHWLKYGEKLLKDRQTLRHYYRCGEKSARGCPAKRMLDINVASGASVVHYREHHIHPPSAFKTNNPGNPGSNHPHPHPPAHGTPTSFRSGDGGVVGAGGAVRSKGTGPSMPLTLSSGPLCAQKGAAPQHAALSSALLPGSAASLLAAALPQGAVNEALERLLFQQLAGASSVSPLPPSSDHTKTALHTNTNTLHPGPALNSNSPGSQAVSQAVSLPAPGTASPGEPCGAPRPSPMAALAAAGGALPSQGPLSQGPLSQGALLPQGALLSQGLRNRSVSSEASNHEAALLQLILHNLPRDTHTPRGPPPGPAPPASGASGASGAPDALGAPGGAFGAATGGGQGPSPSSLSPGPLGLCPASAPNQGPPSTHAPPQPQLALPHLPSQQQQSPPQHLPSPHLPSHGTPPPPACLPDLQPLRALASSQGEAAGGRGALLAPSPLGFDSQRKAGERAQLRGAPGGFSEALPLSEGRGEAQILTPEATASPGGVASPLVSGSVVSGSLVSGSLVSGSSAASEGVITAHGATMQGGPQPQHNPTLQGLLHLLQQARGMAPGAMLAGSHSAPASFPPAAAPSHKDHAPSRSEDGCRATQQEKNSAAASIRETVNSFQENSRGHGRSQAEQCTCLSLGLGLSLGLSTGECRCMSA